MLKPETQAWLDACITLLNDIDAVVRCPICHQADLEVMDVFPKASAPGGERYISCPACKRYDAARVSVRPAKMAAKLIE